MIAFFSLSNEKNAAFLDSKQPMIVKKNKVSSSCILSFVSHGFNSSIKMAQNVFNYMNYENKNKSLIAFGHVGYIIELLLLMLRCVPLAAILSYVYKTNFN